MVVVVVVVVVWVVWGSLWEPLGKLESSLMVWCGF